MTEAGLLLRSADVRWARTVVWTTERGARVAGTGLSAPRPPGERLLHRLAVADAGIALEAHGYTVFSEREVHAAEAVPGRPAELLEALGVPGVLAGARRGETFAVPVGARAVHWPDLVIVEPAPRFPIAVEVELTPKAPAALQAILRAYRQAQRRVLYLATDPVARQLQGGVVGHLSVRPFTAVDPAVARRATQQAARLRGG
ncbi:hypothetical protein NX794_33080 [Streptomyces sp. LP11]|uniref:Restriction endonuclease domain-containing protein n=1 Tax=Streptomyces pyxinicus TaxID=2970331 RepID=A0ABT2BBW2_9ACTN|nr:hypothetical protein [Streptomyces sp. LP11]MCS0606006.1 hypothetical protein [Streptomyces sp. LP11]